MCIAIVKPQNTNISDEYLENCFDNNRDGAGIAYACKGHLHIIKGIFNKKDFVKAVRKAEKIAEGDMLIHCRIGTSGLKDKDNCHPHIVNDSVVMIHNGILDVPVPKNSKVSDTVIFIKKYLKDLPEDFIKNKAILKLIEEKIGDNNKFAFLNNKGESAICNAHKGIVEDGIWYSNDSFSDSIYTFRSSAYDEWDIIDYFQEYITYLEVDEVEFLGDYPLIDTEDYLLVPFTKEKYKNNNRYITLKHYSDYLYQLFQEKREEISEKYKIA